MPVPPEVPAQPVPQEEPERLISLLQIQLVQEIRLQPGQLVLLAQPQLQQYLLRQLPPVRQGQLRIIQIVQQGQQLEGQQLARLQLLRALQQCSPEDREQLREVQLVQLVQRVEPAVEQVAGQVAQRVEPAVEQRVEPEYLTQLEQPIQGLIIDRVLQLKHRSSTFQKDFEGCCKGCLHSRLIILPWILEFFLFSKYYSVDTTEAVIIDNVNSHRTPKITYREFVDWITKVETEWKASVDSGLYPLKPLKGTVPLEIY